MYNLFIDDERAPPAGDRFWVIVRDYQSAVDCIERLGLPGFISFDHDLGDDKTGYDIAKFIVNYCIDNKLEPNFDYYVHSQNPVGKENIERFLRNYMEIWAKTKADEILG